MNLPDYVNTALARLEAENYEAFAVGGCIRDILMEKSPEDWDLCTSAKPEEIKTVFASYQVIDTGISHGTVTVLLDGNPLEVTTYRVDGDYNDSRHPEQVTFTTNLEMDLGRRDFTMNAIAYSPVRGLVDPYGGRKAIENRQICAVGEGERRFREDALRILRALRFAAVLGFSIEEKTASAMKASAGGLGRLSKERINKELSKLILGSWADAVLMEYGSLITQVAPELCQSQIDDLPRNLSARLAVLFPQNTEKALKALRYDKKTIRQSVTLARLLQTKSKSPSCDLAIRKLLCREGEEITLLFGQMKGFGSDVERVIQSGQCYSLKQLALCGGDLIQEQVATGPQVGRILDALLAQVIEGQLPNEKQRLLTEGKRLATTCGSSARLNHGNHA